MSELNDRQAACVMAIQEVREIVAQEVGENQLSVSAVALELYLLSLSMKQEYWSASLKMVDHYCSLVGLDSGEQHGMAMMLYEEKRREIEEERDGRE